MTVSDEVGNSLYKGFLSVNYGRFVIIGDPVSPSGFVDRNFASGTSFKNEFNDFGKNVDELIVWNTDRQADISIILNYGT